MDVRHRHGVLTGRRRRVVAGIATALLASPPGFWAQAPAADSLPQGVTSALVASGKQLFAGEGLCHVCHGADGKGTLGPNLTDAEWFQGSGSFVEIVARIKAGVTMEQSKTGQIMPPRGGANLDDEQVKAVAAYVWTLSRRGGKS